MPDPTRRALLLAGAAWSLAPLEGLADTGRRDLPLLPESGIPAPFQLSAAHVVLRRDLIRGVLRIHNPGPRAWAIADRWNSWGAYLWSFQLGKNLAENPVDTWTENHYTETVLAPSETRALRFTLAVGGYEGPLRDGGPDWFFSLLPAWETPGQAPPPFGPGTRVELRWEETERSRPAFFARFVKEPPTSARAAGLARTLSRRLNHLDDLQPWLTDATGRRLPSLS